MECTCIPYTRVPKSTALLIDYLYHFDRLAPFYSGPPFDLATYEAVAGEVRQTSQPRRELTEIFERQNKAFGSGEATFNNIDRLSEPGTFAVVTGQQVALASGPAFTLYKALTAVRLAQWLSQQGLPAVPIFWLATEDHDLQEVAQAATFNEDYELVPLTDSGERPAPRSSVGYVRLSAEIHAAMGTLDAVLPAGDARDQVLRDLRAAYQPGIRWGEAFGRLMARLFRPWGVVLLDPLDETVHRLSSQLYERALIEAAGLRGRLEERSRALVRAGYHAQVHVTEGATLIFTTRDGNRVPVRQRDAGQDDFVINEAEDASFEKLKAHLEARPADFSPNVLLRPVVQDSLLPTIAYVAGPSELAYLGQAQAIYSVLGRRMPVIFPRAGFTLIDRKVRRWMEKYRLTVEDVWKGEEHLELKIAGRGLSEGGAESWAERFERSEQDLKRLLEWLRPDIEKLDPTLLDALKTAEDKMTYQMERLKGKLSRAALERSELLRRHEQMLLRFLAPRKSLQEREVTGVYFLGRAGYELLDRLLGQIQTRSSDHQVFDY